MNEKRYGLVFLFSLVCDRISHSSEIYQEKNMIDKNIFTETLHEVAEIARTSDQPLSKEEIRKYFSDM